jgi:hypothetical protein
MVDCMNLGQHFAKGNGRHFDPVIGGDHEHDQSDSVALDGSAH